MRHLKIAIGLESLSSISILAANGKPVTRSSLVCIAEPFQERFELTSLSQHLDAVILMTVVVTNQPRWGDSTASTASIW